MTADDESSYKSTSSSSGDDSLQADTETDEFSLAFDWADSDSISSNDDEPTPNRPNWDHPETLGEDTNCKKIKGLDFVSHEGVACNLPMFPTKRPDPNDIVRASLDIDAIGVHSSSWRHVIHALAHEDNTFVLPTFLNNYSGISKTSRFSVNSNQEFKPKVKGRERSSFPLHQCPNYTLCQINHSVGIASRFSLFIMNPYAVGKPILDHDTLGAICSALNAARLYAATLGDAYLKNSPVWKDVKKDLVHKLGLLQPFQIKDTSKAKAHHLGPNSQQYLNGTHGYLFLKLFFHALEDMSGGIRPDEDPKIRSRLGIRYGARDMHSLEVSEGEDAMWNKFRIAAKFLLNDTFFGSVAAGTKSILVDPSISFPWSEAEDKMKELQLRSKEKVMGLCRQLFKKTPQSQACPIFYTYDVGLELFPDQDGTNFYPLGIVADELVKKAKRTTVFNISADAQQQTPSTVVTPSPMVVTQSPVDASQDYFGFNQDDKCSISTQGDEESDQDEESQESSDHDEDEGSQPSMDEPKEGVDYYPESNHIQINDCGPNKYGGGGVDEDEADTNLITYRGTGELENSFSLHEANHNLGDQIPDVAAFTRVKNQRPRHCYKYTSGYLGGAHDTNIHVRLRVMQAGAGRPSRVVVVPVNSRNSYSSIRGMQIYSPWEKTLYSKKSCEPYYTRLKSLAAKVQLMLTESLNSKQETQVFKNAQEEVKHLINHGYAIHSSTLRFHSENAKCPVRFEFVVLSNDVFHNEDVFQCPISTLSDDIRATIVQACSYHVCCDLVRQLTFFFPPLMKLVEQEFSNLTKYSPVMKTMLVFCAEGVENILDTGRFFFSGIHRRLQAKHGKNCLGRLQIPAEGKVPLSQEERFLSKLEYGLPTNLLPSCPPCTRDFKIKGKDKNVSHFVTQAYDTAKQLHLMNKQHYVDAMRDLIIVKYVCCHPQDNPQLSGVDLDSIETQGVMEGLQLENWARKPAATKEESIKALAKIYLTAYRNEFHDMVVQKLSKSNSQQDLQGLKKTFLSIQQYQKKMQALSGDFQISPTTLTKNGKFFLASSFFSRQDSVLHPFWNR